MARSRVVEARTKWCCSTGDLKKGRPSRTNKKPLSPCGTHAGQRYVWLRPSGETQGTPGPDRLIRKLLLPGKWRSTRLAALTVRAARLSCSTHAVLEPGRRVPACAAASAPRALRPASSRSLVASAAPSPVLLSAPSAARPGADPEPSGVGSGPPAAGAGGLAASAPALGGVVGGSSKTKVGSARELGSTGPTLRPSRYAHASRMNVREYSAHARALQPGLCLLAQRRGTMGKRLCDLQPAAGQPHLPPYSTSTRFTLVAAGYQVHWLACAWGNACLQAHAWHAWFLPHTS